METATAATSQAQQQYRRLLVAAVMLTIGWPLCFAAVVIIVATINTQCWAVNPALHTYMCPLERRWSSGFLFLCSVLLGLVPSSHLCKTNSINTSAQNIRPIWPRMLSTVATTRRTRNLSFDTPVGKDMAYSRGPQREFTLGKIRNSF